MSSCSLSPILPPSTRPSNLSCHFAYSSSRASIASLFTYGIERPHRLESSPEREGKHHNPPASLPLADISKSLPLSSLLLPVSLSVAAPNLPGCSYLVTVQARSYASSSEPDLKETLAKVIPAKRELLKKVKAHSDKKIGDLKVENTLGGMRYVGLFSPPPTNP